MDNPMTEGSPYTAVYEALDEAVFADSVPLGTRGTIYHAIDDLMKLDAPSDHVELAGRISVALHKLEQARRNRDCAEETRAREELQAAGAQWLQIPMRLLH